jgi:hypothetical protein
MPAIIDFHAIRRQLSDIFADYFLSLLTPPLRQR